jgi:hypothetical protein
MQTIDTSAPADLTHDQAELTERELNDVVAGLLPAVGPAAKGKCPTAVE